MSDALRTSLRSYHPIRSIAGATTLLAAALGVTGCQMGDVQLSGSTPEGPVAGAALGGVVHGGQFPVFGASLQLYAAGAPAAPTGSNPIVGGLGQGATALLTVGSMTVGSTNNYFPGGTSGCPYTTGNPSGCTALPMTGVGGTFSISGDYVCPSASSQVYLVATGGDPTGANSTSIHNNFLAMMAALGSCGALQANAATTFISLNEVTTVGAVYALNQFMASPSGVAAGSYSSQGGTTSGVAVNIGASSGPAGGYGADAVQTQQIGLTNAFRMVNNISDYTQGTANPVAANTWANPYSAKTYTIADILAACINTNPSVSSTACNSLMADTKYGSYTPEDTIQAAWSMARFPTNNVSGLYGLIAGTGTPFPNDLASAPGELTIEVGLAPQVPGGNPLNALGANAISNPSAGAFDEYGHLWLENMNPQAATATTAAPNDNVFVSEIDANGAYLNGPYNTYTAHGGYQVGGADPCASGYLHSLAYNGSSVAEAVAVDLSNTVWVTNQMEYTNNGGIANGDCSSTAGYALMRITGSNSAGTGAALTTGYYAKNSIVALAVDPNNNVWAPPSSYSTGGAPILTFAANTGAFSTGAFNFYTSGQSAIVDANGNFWASSADVCGSYGGIVFESPLSSAASPTLSGGFYSANDANCPATSAGTPALDGGTQTVNSAASLGEPYGLAPDANGGIWVADYKVPTNTGNPTLTYLLPGSGAWLNSGTQGAPNTANPIPATAAMSTPTTFAYGMSLPYYLAVDGSNNVWVANSSTQRVSEFSATLSGTGSAATISSIQSIPAGGSGYTLPQTNVSPFIDGGAKWVGIDPSGNVWFASTPQTNGSTTQANWITVMVGAATPVITPLAMQAKYGRIGQTPQ